MGLRLPSQAGGFASACVDPDSLRLRLLFNRNWPLVMSSLRLSAGLCLLHWKPTI